MKKKFDSIAVISAATGRLLSSCKSDDGFSRMYEVIEFMYGPIFVHQLPNMEEKIRADLLRMHPYIKDIQTKINEECDKGNIWQLTDSLIEKFGRYLEIECQKQEKKA